MDSPTEVDFVADILADNLPRVTLASPKIRLLQLLATLIKPLDERAVVVPDAVAPDRNILSCFHF